MKKSELEMLIKLRDKTHKDMVGCVDMFTELDNEIEKLENFYNGDWDEDEIEEFEEMDEDEIQESINELNRDYDKYTGSYGTLVRVVDELNQLIDKLK